MTESDSRAQILGSILSTPHGKLDDMGPVHQRAVTRDPRFYMHLAVWYAHHGEVRDHKVLFVVHLLCAPREYPELRAVGYCLLQRLPVHQVDQAIKYAKRQRQRNVPRIFETAVRHYIRTLEQNEGRLNAALVRSRDELLNIYAGMHIRPSEPARRTLFDGEPLEGSPAWAVKQIAGSRDEAEQARLIVQYSVPYPIAVGAVSALTPVVMGALVHVMTPGETLNHLKQLQRRGILEHPDLRQLVDEKLAAAKTDSRVSTLKAARAMESLTLDAKLAADITTLIDERVAAIGRIGRRVALCVDKSISMTDPIVLAKELAAPFAALCESLVVYFFNTEANRIAPPATNTRAGWISAMRWEQPDGGTLIGAPLDEMREAGEVVDQIVLITDAGDNRPTFAPAYHRYCQALGVQPDVAAILVGSVDDAEVRGWHEAGVPLAEWPFSGDYYAIPNLLNLLVQPTRRDLVAQILATELPARPSIAV